MRPSLAVTLRVFEKYQQLIHRHAPAFIRHVLEAFRQHTLSAVHALLGYFNQRASKLAEMQQSLSPRQQGKILKDSERKLERVLNSETLQAQVYDYEMFGVGRNETRLKVGNNRDQSDGSGPI